MSCEEYDFLTERIAATKAAIVAHEEAQLAIIAGGIESYTLDTGQSRQIVTRVNLSVLDNVIKSLYNQYVTLLARRDGCGSAHVLPWW